MVYKNYTLGLLKRIAFIVIAAISTGYFIAIEKNNVMFEIISVLFLAAAIIMLINYIQKTNKQINYFIQAVKNDDTTLRFPKNSGNKTIDELHQSLNELNVILQDNKQKSRIKELYFYEILQQLSTGIIVFNNNGFVTEVNNAALETLGLNVLTHLKQIDRVDKNIRQRIENLCDKHKEVINVKRNDEIIQLAIRCSSIKLKNEELTLLTLQDIHGELERKEIDSWIKLIRVLSHEIMNSLTPVTSITQSLQRLWLDNKANKQQPEKEIIESTISGLEVIGERGDALIRFVNSYRLLSQLPAINLSKVSVAALFDRLNILTSPLREKYPNTSIQYMYPETDFTITIDEQLFVQLVLNLVKNSFEAIQHQHNGNITINCTQNRSGNLKLSVTDNGPGIAADLSDDIFVPFFSTKTDGSGVGLSFSRQIVRAHGGTIKFNSTSDKTIFTIEI